MSARGRILPMLPVLLLPVAVQAKSIDDCERFKAPLAYNQCLAEFSPARRHHAGDPPPQMAPALNEAPARTGRASRPARTSQPLMAPSSPIRRSGGRSIATFEIGPAGGALHGHARRR